MSSFIGAHEEDHTFQYASLCLPRRIIIHSATVKRSRIRQADRPLPYRTTYESVDCIILGLDLLEFDDLTNAASVRSKCDALTDELLRPFSMGLSRFRDTMLLFENKAMFAGSLRSRHTNDDFSGSRGVNRAMKLIAKSITSSDRGHSFAEMDVDQDTNSQALHDALAAFLNSAIIVKFLQLTVL